MYEDQTKKMEKILDKRTVVIHKRDENARKIRELGSLPESKILGDLKDFTLGELIEKLMEVNSGLKKYSTVNKKALDQYMNFSHHKEELGERKLELDTGAQSVSYIACDGTRKETRITSFTCFTCFTRKSSKQANFWPIYMNYQ